MYSPNLRPGPQSQTYKTARRMLDDAARFVLAPQTHASGELQNLKGMFR